MVDLEEEFNIEIGDEWLSVDSFETIQKLYAFIESEVVKNENSN